jgi:hypothetical protein
LKTESTPKSKLKSCANSNGMWKSRASTFQTAGAGGAGGMGGMGAIGAAGGAGGTGTSAGSGGKGARGTSIGMGAGAGMGAAGGGGGNGTWAIAPIGLRASDNVNKAMRVIVLLRRSSSGSVDFEFRG